MDWKAATKDDKGMHRIPKRWLHIHYYEALNILFRFENSLRVFVYTVLKNSYGTEWTKCQVSSGGDGSKLITGIASKRISQAENFGYLGFSIESPIMHLTSGELIDIITADAYWVKFKPYFKGSREIIKNKLLEIGSVRNSIAHFRPIQPEDVELIKQNSRHVLLGVESSLENAFNQPLRVPTNTHADWYDSVKTLGTDYVKIIPHMSSDGAWLNVKMVFSLPQFDKNNITNDYLTFVLGNLNTPGILLKHPQFTKFVTYVSERITYPSLTDDFDIRVDKEVNAVFLMKAFEENHTAVAAELKSILSKISDECEMLSQDTLAKGEMVEAATVSAYFYARQNESEGNWRYMYESLTKGYEPQHPDEYWGTQQFVTDVVGGARRYPWMPVDISEQEGFFD